MEKTSKKVVQGIIEIDYDDPALILNYEVEVVCQDENGRTLVLERNPGTITTTTTTTTTIILSYYHTIILSYYHTTTIMIVNTMIIR